MIAVGEMQFYTKILSGTLATLGSLAVHGLASAASFDCGHATAPREQLICHDPVLSDLDGELGRMYREKRALLSLHGVELLQRSEQNWLHFIATVCPLIAPAGAALPQAPAECFQARYRERVEQLAQVGQRLGPFVFNRIDLYVARAASDAGDSTSGFYIWHVAYPQIDNPQSPQATSWNEQNVKGEGSNGVDGCQENTDYELGYAAENLISLQWSNTDDCEGTVHGTYSFQAQSVVLLPKPRPLTAHDLFRDGDGSEAKLQELFLDALRAEDWSPSDDQAKAEILGDVVQPDRWFLTTKGLEVSFNAYEGGCYACTLGPVTVSWEKLKPLLAPSAIVP